MIQFSRELQICAFLFGLTALVTAEEPWIEQGRGVPQFLETVAKKKKAHVAFLGGSITENTKGHTAMVPAWLKETYPECEFTFTNAGLSSTCSMSGAFRLEDHLLKKGPIDLLIVEFAVNDDQDAGHDRETAIRGLEGIVRHFRKTNPGGDIISVQFVNIPILQKFQEGGEAVSVAAHKEVARHYNLPIVDVGKALAAGIEAGNNSWETYGGVHPKTEGYRFASDLIISVIKNSSPADGSENWALVPPLEPRNFENGRFIDPQTGSWLGGWKFAKPDSTLLPQGGIRKGYTVYNALRSDEPGTMIYLPFAGEMLGAFVLAGPDAGILEVSIDDGEWQKIDLYHKHSKGLNYPRSVMLADGLKNQRHQAAIRISEDKNPESKGHGATILFFEENFARNNRY